MTDKNEDIDGPSPSPAMAGLLSAPDDSSLITSGTALAPSCPAPIATALSDVKPFALDDLAPGDRVDDFEIVSLLGRGAFGAVYLARQLSLDRQVALKVTAWQGGEGRKMARLEHENIVQVFSETAYDDDTPALVHAVCAPARRCKRSSTSWPMLPIAARSGQKLLDARRSARRPAGGLRSGRVAESRIASPARLARNRLLDRCPIGRGPRLRPQPRRDPSRHQAGQHHAQPVWPASAGRFQPGVPAAGRRRPRDDRLGGTLAYMAPEHLDAFAPRRRSAQGDRRPGRRHLFAGRRALSDGWPDELPFTETPPGKTKSEVLRAMAAQRRDLPPPLPPELPRALDQVDRPLPASRSGPAVRLGLRACRPRWKAAATTRPPKRPCPTSAACGRWSCGIRRSGCSCLALLPHLVASVINIVYNYSRIITS